MGLALGIPTGNPRYSLDGSHKLVKQKREQFFYIYIHFFFFFRFFDIFAIVALVKEKEEETGSGTNVKKRIARSEAGKR